MVDPYLDQSLKKTTFFQRLFNKLPVQNAIVELNNLLAKAQTIKGVNNQDIDSIANSYKVNISKKFHKDLEKLYKEFLGHCLKDKLLSDEELSDLAHLKDLFDLNDKTISKIHNELTQAIYNETVQEAISDGRLDENEKKFLAKIEENLKIPNELATKIYTEKASKYLHEYLASAFSDQRLSPDEENELNALTKGLGINVAYDIKTKESLDRFRLYWLIENGEIPEISTDISLPKKEKCYFNCAVDWYEHRKVTKRIRYGGPTARLRIMKGVYWSMGDVGVQRVSEDTLAHIDSGQLYLTNKRLIFMGNRNNQNINLSKVLDFTPYKNGVDIQKDSGKSPFIKFDQGVDVFCMILSRTMND